MPDVHAFPDHIACDSASNAEPVPVLPLMVGEALNGVFALDSAFHGRFDDTAAGGLSAMLATRVMARTGVHLASTRG